MLKLEFLERRELMEQVMSLSESLLSFYIFTTEPGGEDWSIPRSLLISVSSNF